MSAGERSVNPVLPEDGTLNAAHRNPLPCSHCSGLASEETAATHRIEQRIPARNPPKIRCKWRVIRFKGDLSFSLCPRQTFLVNRGACQPHARGAPGVCHHRVRTPRRGVPARVPRGGETNFPRRPLGAAGCADKRGVPASWCSHRSHPISTARKREDRSLPRSSNRIRGSNGTAYCFAR